jgi:hypothetical protein
MREAGFSRRLFSTILGTALLSAVALPPMSGQITDQSAREQVRNVVRSELHLKPDGFLRVQRDEKLEQLLAMAVLRPSWLMFIYEVSEEGVEIKENTVIYHTRSDFNPADGITYRIRGFGFADSLADFEKLMTAARLKVSSPEQAQSIADFYRGVNPENNLSLTPIWSLINLKQAVERECETSSLDAGEKAFDAWWKRAKPLYLDASFKETVTPSGDGYFVEWVILSSAGHDKCGGAPLRARIEVSSDGHVGKVAYSAIGKK